MSDPADEAAKFEEVFTQSALENAKSNTGRRLVFTGFCHNCLDPVDDPQRFCDSECMEDWEYVRNRKRANGLA